jgi:hypothetical protein
MRRPVDHSRLVLLYFPILMIGFNSPIVSNSRNDFQFS